MYNYACTCVCTDVHRYSCMFYLCTYKHVYFHTYIYMYMHGCMYVHVCTLYEFTFIPTYVPSYVHVCTCIFVYMYAQCIYLCTYIVLQARPNPKVGRVWTQPLHQLVPGTLYVAPQSNSRTSRNVRTANPQKINNLTWRCR